jgi:hypothetical protein
MNKYICDSKYKSASKFISKRYKVILEHIKISIVSDNYDVNNNVLSIGKNMEFVPVVIQRIIKIKEEYELADLETNNYALTYQEIKKYCARYISNSNVNSNIVVVPCYIVDNILVLGVVEVAGINKTSSSVVKINNASNDLLLCLSDITITSVIGDKILVNILGGIIHNRINKDSNELKPLKNKNVIISLKEKKTVSQENKGLIIKWEHILMNIANYLPRITLIYSRRCE